jgi:hypothetical protein
MAAMPSGLLIDGFSAFGKIQIKRGFTGISRHEYWQRR